MIVEKYFHHWYHWLFIVHVCQPIHDKINIKLVHWFMVIFTSKRRTRSIRLLFLWHQCSNTWWGTSSLTKWTINCGYSSNNVIRYLHSCNHQRPVQLRLILWTRSNNSKLVSNCRIWHKMLHKSTDIAATTECKSATQKMDPERSICRYLHDTSFENSCCGHTRSFYDRISRVQISSTLSQRFWGHSKSSNWEVVRTLGWILRSHNCLVSK